MLICLPPSITLGQDSDTVSDTASDSALATNADDELEDIDLLDMEVPMVVTATRHEQRLTMVPYATSVITAEDIRRSGARSIPDALRLVPGMDVADLSFGNAAVSPRGFHGVLARQVLVLVDGRQVFDSLFGGTLWGSWPFLLEDVDRIEVIRGPGGVAWGANAVNGVINIITKAPAEQLGLTVTTGGGSRGTFKQHVGYGMKEGDLELRISGEYEASDGYRKGGSIFRGLADDYKAGRISLKAVQHLEGGDRFTLSMGSAVLDGGYPPTPLGGVFTRRNSGSQASFIMGTWLHRVADRNDLTVTGYVNDFYMSPGISAIDYRYQQLALQIGQSLALKDTHLFSWGIDGRVDLLDASNADPFMLRRCHVNTVVIGVYFQDRWQIRPKWALDYGARVDYESYGGFEPSARVALSYELSDDSVLYAAVSRAFQMPPVGLRFLDIPLVNGISRVIGRRDIAPETLVAYELGYRGRWFDRVETSLNLFWHEFDHLTTMSPRPGPPGLMRMDVDNRGQASMYGLELETRYSITDDLTLLGNYTYQQMDWSSRVPFHDKDSVSPPKHKAMVGVRYSPTDDLHLSSHLYYVAAVEAPNPANPFGHRDVDPYLRLDLNAEYEFSDDRASIAVGVRNLLDSNHYEGGTLFLNSAEVPRMVYAELRFSIK